MRLFVLKSLLLSVRLSLSSEPPLSSTACSPAGGSESLCSTSISLEPQQLQWVILLQQRTISSTGDECWEHTVKWVHSRGVVDESLQSAASLELNTRHHDMSFMDRSYLHMGFKSNVLFAFACRKCQMCENSFLNWYLALSAIIICHRVEPSRHFFLRMLLALQVGGACEAYFKMQTPTPHPLISCLPTGLGDYMKRYGEGIKRVLNSFGPVPDFNGGEAESIAKVSLMVAKDQTWTKQGIEPHMSPHGNLQCAVWMSQYQFIRVKSIYSTQVVFSDGWLSGSSV